MMNTFFRHMERGTKMIGYWDRILAARLSRRRALAATAAAAGGAGLLVACGGGGNGPQSAEEANSLLTQPVDTTSQVVR